MSIPGVNLNSSSSACNGSLSLVRDVLGGKAVSKYLLERSLLVAHNFVIEQLHVFRCGVGKDRVAEAIDEMRHTRTAGVVVAGDLEKVGVFSNLRIIIDGAIEGTEGDILHHVEAKWLLRSNSFGAAVKF